MSNRNSNIVDLRHVEREGLTRQLLLDGDFFRQMNQEEIQDGRLQVELRVAPAAGDSFSFCYSISGYVVVACHRCLEPVKLSLSFQDVIKIGHGDETDSDGELTLIPFSQLTYDVTADMLELILLNLPLQRVHPEGECNVDMLSRFSIEEDES